ncbi:MAG: 4'-phosphopantetheinyl transferase superfamily protein [Phycisphaerae bacterium]|nr:4'-phosphopantetheinyl transferase superfamily protein [Saprospiraceae bacterium]
MPLLLTNHPFPGATFGLWQIVESEAFFRADLPLSSAEESDLTQHRNPLRRLEWLAGRWLLHKLTDAPQRLPMAKDAFSKPFFPENQHLGCSLSHSKGTVGALIVNSQKSTVNSQQSTVNSQQSIGCDIQVLTEKMSRIAHKFLNEVEKGFVENRLEEENLDLLHLFWTAKESLYKAYGLKALDFRENIFVEIGQWDGLLGEGIGRVEKGDFMQEFQLVFSKIVLPEEGELVTAICQER